MSVWGKLTNIHAINDTKVSIYRQWSTLQCWGDHVQMTALSADVVGLVYN